MSILITGAGLIGRLAAEQLSARGDKVVLIDIRAPSAPLTDPSILFESCDVCDRAQLADILRRHAVAGVIHTAAMLSTGIRRDPVAGVSVNVVGTANVLECARQANIRRVVTASSTTVAYTTFGRHGAGPILEDQPLHLLSERPASVYAVTKLAGEQLALLYSDLYGLDTVVLRFGAVLGGGAEPPTSVPGRLLALLAAGGGSGGPVRLDDPFLLWGGREEFVDARDCASACVHALDAANPLQRVYNIAPGSWHSLEEFIAVVRRVFPALIVAPTPTISTGFAGFPHQRPAPSSTAAAREELGFVCAHDLEDAIRHWS